MKDLIIINWNKISKIKNLDENFIKNNEKYLNWNYISKFQKLSKEFLYNNYKMINWYKASQFQDLDERIIYDLKDKVYFNWYFIFRYQKINFSKKFILNFLNKMNNYTLYDIDNNNYYTEDIIHDFGMNIEDIYKTKKLIKNLKNKILIKYIISKIGDIGILINEFI
jgi:hypothetical protein